MDKQLPPFSQIIYLAMHFLRFTGILMNRYFSCPAFAVSPLIHKILAPFFFIILCLTIIFGIEQPSALASPASPQKHQVAPSSAKKATVKKKSTKQTAQKRTKKKKVVTIGNNYKGAILYNADTQEIIFSRRDNVHVPPASLTKIMSMYIVFDAVREQKAHLSSLVPISPKAATTGGSSMGIHADEMIPLNQLLKGMAICSGNDASVAVAEYIGGTEEAFVEMMNTKARELGMNDTVFKNAHGLHVPGQHTTAADMLLLARSYLGDYPENLEIYHSNKQYTYKGKTTRNANSLLGKYEGVNGLKTGYVAAAGYNLITTAKHDGIRVISVLLGAPTSKIREQEVTHLLDNHLPKPAHASQENQVAVNQ